jgi:3-oxoadipate enol-lactonase
MPRVRVGPAHGASGAGELALHYQWTGAAEGPVLVLVNGLLTDLGSWAPHLPRLADFRCLSYDCRGQGASDAPEAEHYPVAEHGRDLGHLLDALGVVEPVHVIGLSNGGAAGLCLAAAQPERVASLVVCGAYARCDRLLELKLRSWIAAMEHGGARLRFDVATPWIWGPRFLAEHAEALLGYRSKGEALPAAVAERLIAGAIAHHLDDEELRRVQARTLVVVGAEDLLTPPRMAREIAQGVPGARLCTLSELGHAAALEDVERFCAMVCEFLAGAR